MTNQGTAFRNLPAFEPAPGDPLAYLSASRLKSYLTCRLKFYFEKVLSLTSPSSPNLHVGKAVHAGLQRYNTSRWRGEPCTREDVIQAYRASYSELEEADPVEYGSKGRDDCLETGERVISTYMDSPIAQDNRRILGVEVYLRQEAGELPLPMVGFLDLVVEGNVPVDYKTIGTTPNLDEEAWQNQLQLTVYHQLLKDATGEEPSPGELVYLTKLKTPKIIKQELPPVTSVQVDRLKALTDTYIDGIQREDFYPSPGMHCRWCSFRQQCSAWAGKSALAA